ALLNMSRWYEEGKLVEALGELMVRLNPRSSMRICRGPSFFLFFGCAFRDMPQNSTARAILPIGIAAKLINFAIIKAGMKSASFSADVIWKKPANASLA